MASSRASSLAVPCITFWSGTNFTRTSFGRIGNEHSAGNRSFRSPRWSSAMIIRVTDARLVRDFVIRLRFNDGSEGEIDFSDELEGPIFEPLKDPKVFAAFRLDPEIHTL